MSGKFYINPAAIILKNGDSYILRMGANFSNTIEEYQIDMLCSIREKTRAFSMEEILETFTIAEANTLFSHNVFVTEPIELESIYSRNKCYFAINGDYDQAELMSKRVLILGAGAVGAHLAWMLATAGVINLTIVDFDDVEVSNLNRQLLYKETDVGQPKTEVLKNALLDINRELNIDTKNVCIESEDQLREIAQTRHFDLVVAAIDTPGSARRWINSVCVDLKIPYVSGGLLGEDGIIGISYYPDVTPCHECFELEENIPERISGVFGTFSPIVEFICSKMAIEAVNMLLKRTNGLRYVGCFEQLSFVNNTSRNIEPPLRTECPKCGRHNEPTRVRNYSLINIIYYVLAMMLPFSNAFSSNGPIIVILGIILINLLPVIGTRDENIYMLGMKAALMYVVSNIALTFAINPQAMVFTDNVISQVANLLSAILTQMISMSMFFMGMILVYSLIKEAIQRRARQKISRLNKF